MSTNIPLPDLQNIYNTQQMLVDVMNENEDYLLPEMSTEALNRINEEIGRFNLEGGQPDPVGDDAAQNSPNASIDAGLQDMSLNPNMSPEEAAGKHGTTVDALDNRNSQLAQMEPTLGAIVSFIGTTFGPKIGSMVENLRETPRQSYSRMTSRFAQAKYGLPPSEYGLSLPSFSPKSKTEPVSFVPYSPEDQALHEAQQAAAAQEEAEFGLGPEKAGGYDSKNQATIDAAIETARDQEGFGGPSSPDSRGGPSQGGGTSGSGRGGTGSSGSLSGGFDGPDSSDDGVGTEGFGGEMDAAGLNTGGRIGALIQHLQTGGDVENAETDLGNANVPMGVVDDPDGAPGPFSGGTGVEDDLDMDVESGSYVLNAESVQLIGISDINAVIRDAYTIAVALGKPVPKDYDAQNKVPIRISNGEAVIPKPLVDIIGLDKLEKWNQKGLQLRKQKEKMMAEQQKAQPPQQQQVAAEAPMQQQMGQLMDRGGQVFMSQKEAQDKLYPEEEEIQKLQRLFRTDDSGPNKLNINENITVEEAEEDIDPEELQRLLRVDDSGPSKTGQPQLNINENITVEEKNNVMAAQVGKTPVIPKSTFNLRKYTDNYDVVYGHDLYTPKLSNKRITRMTVKEIFSNQDLLKKATEDETHTSTAHGPYQINKDTLKDLMKRYKYDINTIFTPAFQDNLATDILRESRVFKFIKDPSNKKHNLTTVQNKLAKRWASLPISGFDKKSAHEDQEAALTSTEFREILKRVQELGATKGIPLLLKTIRKAEAALR